LHSKFLIIDDEVSIIGSSNMDERSFAMNLEVKMFIVSKDFTQRKYELEAQRYAPNSVELDVEDWADRSLLKKYVENVARLTSSLLRAPRGGVGRCSRGAVQTPSGADPSCDRCVRTLRSVVVGDSAGPLVVEMRFRIPDRVASLGRGFVLGLRRGG